MILALGMWGCARTGAPESLAVPSACAPGTAPGSTTMLYLGRARPGQPGEIGDAQLRAFLDREVTPRFPGFTLLDGAGSWKGELERTKLLIVAHCGGRALPDLEAITAAYARTFSQEAVGRTDYAVCQNFCSPGS